jgi:hypothetical protein
MMAWAITRSRRSLRCRPMDSPRPRVTPCFNEKCTNVNVTIGLPTFYGGLYGDPPSIRPTAAQHAGSIAKLCVLVSISGWSCIPNSTDFYPSVRCYSEPAVLTSCLRSHRLVMYWCHLNLLHSRHCQLHHRLPLPIRLHQSLSSTTIAYPLVS